VRSEFLARHPGYIVEFIGAGEGDSDNVYYHVRYRKPGATVLFEQQWLYQDHGEKEWTCTWRSDEATLQVSP